MTWLQGFNWTGVGGLTALICAMAWLLVVMTREENNRG